MIEIFVLFLFFSFFLVYWLKIKMVNDMVNKNDLTFLKVYDVVLSNSVLNSTEKLILSLLISSNGKCRYKQSTMAERLGISKFQVNRSIQSLISKKLITLSADNGLNKTRNYNLRIDDINSLLKVQLIPSTENKTSQFQADSTDSFADVEEIKMIKNVALTDEKEEEDELEAAFNEHNEPTYIALATNDEEAIAYWKSIKKEKTFEWIDFQQQFQNMYNYQKRKGIEEEDMIAIGNIHHSIPYEYLNWGFRYWLKKKTPKSLEDEK